MSAITAVFVIFLCGSSLATPMLYKKNTNDKYEAGD